jgi:peptidoglycan hydrolase-like protein with peptidoglycan-binding domain
MSDSSSGPLEELSTMAYTYTYIDGQRVQTDVAAAFNRLNTAFNRAFGLWLKVRSGTRTYEEQKAIFLARYRPQATGSGPYGDVRWWNGTRYVRYSSAGTVATPGTSNHEEGGPVGPRALDIYDTGSSVGVTTAGNARSNWIRNNAGGLGFNPAGYNFGEPWHIEYNGGFGGGGSTAGGVTGQFPARELYGAAWVIEIQKKLNRLAYGLDVDGYDGPATQRAVSDFQGKHGLPVDGIAGPVTNAKLDAVLAGSGEGKLAVDGQWGEATTRKLQSVLGVTVDGQLGPQTISALQTRLKVTVDGEMGPQTIQALQKVLGVETDGALGPQTISALQNYLNNGGTFSDVVVPVPSDEKLVVDGQWGEATTRALQKNLGVAVDGILGAETIKKLQTVMGQTADGQMGQITVRALQMNVGSTVDGALGPNTIKALQEFLNANKIFKAVVVEVPSVVTYPKPEAPTYPAADWWNHSPNCSPRRDGDVIQYFVIHHAADTRPVEIQRDRFMTPNDRNVSPNWLIGADGSVHEIVPPDKYRAWTTGQFDYKAVTVETQNTSGDPNWGISEESHVAIAKLVAWAHLRWNIPLDRQHVLGHREVPNVPATACPGPSMDLDKILSYAIQFVKEVPTEEPGGEEPGGEEPGGETPEVWEVSLPLTEAQAAGKFLDELRKLFP